MASTHVASAVDVEIIKFSTVFVEIFRPVADNIRSLNFAARCAGVNDRNFASECSASLAIARLATYNPSSRFTSLQSIASRAPARLATSACSAVRLFSKASATATARRLARTSSSCLHAKTRMGRNMSSGRSSSSVCESPRTTSLRMAVRVSSARPR